ncbi:hypothetical protein GOODEAATRI_026010, partial [Goodea atripinnis]
LPKKVRNDCLGSRIVAVRDTASTGSCTSVSTSSPTARRAASKPTHARVRTCSHTTDEGKKEPFTHQKLSSTALVKFTRSPGEFQLPVPRSGVESCRGGSCVPPLPRLTFPGLIRTLETFIIRYWGFSVSEA